MDPHCQRRLGICASSCDGWAHNRKILAKNVPSEFLLEPWREHRDPEAFYRMRIPAQDIPLTDVLEVLILSKSGEQLACIKRQI